MAPHAINKEVEVDTGLACLLVIARLYGIPADPEQLKHEFSESGKQLDATQLLRISKHLGLKARTTETQWSRLPLLNLPAIGVLQDGRFVIIAKADDEKVLIQDPTESKMLSLPKSIFLEAWANKLILFTKRANLRAEDRKFDFTWFIPAIVKHRKLLGEVLLASFFLQLFALLTPLFFQIVIDKVLVHKGLMTLHVLAIGMLAIVIFEVVLGGLRTYVFSHTTSRIDVGLGA